jgi:hypothetical protein
MSVGKITKTTPKKIPNKTINLLKIRFQTLYYFLIIISQNKKVLIKFFGTQKIFTRQTKRMKKQILEISFFPCIFISLLLKKFIRETLYLYIKHNFWGFLFICGAFWDFFWVDYCLHGCLFSRPFNLAFMIKLFKASQAGYSQRFCSILSIILETKNSHTTPTKEQNR